MKINTLSLLAAALALVTRAVSSEFTAHEWGTFTSVQGADGVPVQWQPTLATDLPRFVYSRAVANGGFRTPPLSDPFRKAGTLSLMRMETPVIYFYSEQARTVDVQVRFPQGRMTEWYPQATHVGPFTSTNRAEFLRASQSVIEWKGVKILPPGSPQVTASTLIRDAVDRENHYYAARETDANLLAMSSPHARTAVEYERDLFYRGVGFLAAPLRVKLDEGLHQLELTNSFPAPLTDLFVLTVREGRAAAQFLERVEPGRTRTVAVERTPSAPLDEVRAGLMRDMARALVRQGLFAREAEAMVNTWKDQWFAEEGTRVLYLLPRAWTDQTLPLVVQPAPDRVERVMVGRAEIIRPETEQALARHVTRYSTGSARERQQVIAEARGLALGRFVDPAMRRITAQRKDQAFVQAAWELAAQLAEPATRPANSADTAALAPNRK